MHRLCSIAAASMLIGCASLPQESSVVGQVCDINFAGPVEFKELDIELYSTQHGSYVTIDACPDQGRAVDYSATDIVKKPDSELAKRVRMNAFNWNQSIRMTVSGSYRGATADRRATITISRILRYAVRPEAPTAE